jgi:CRP/FNR family transcriptional regulator
MAALLEARSSVYLVPSPKAPSNLDRAYGGVPALSVCAALGLDELEILHPFSRTLRYAARETLFQQNERSDSVYSIISGSLRLYKLLRDGRCQIVGFALPGDFLGLSLSDHNAFSADALTAMTACKFSRQAFSDLVDGNPRVLRRLHSAVSHDLSLAQDQMVILGLRSAHEKVAAFLMGLHERWSRVDGSKVHVPLPMTRQDIGDFLGLTVETVSRMLTRLAREKAIIIVPDGVRLLDIARLEALAEC